MFRDYLDLKFLQGIAPNIPSEKLIRIIEENQALASEELIELLLFRNESMENSENSQKVSHLSGDEIFTLECTNFPCYNKDCRFFHDQTQFRRPQRQFSYYHTPCKYVFQCNTWNLPSKCQRKNQCRFAHTENEVKFYIFQETTKSTASEPLENIKIEENYDNGLSDLIEIIKSLHIKIQEKKTSIQRKKEELLNYDSKISFYHNFSACLSCKTNEHEYFIIPCGHTACKNCAAFGYCKYCKENLEILIKSQVN